MDDQRPKIKEIGKVGQLLIYNLIIKARKLTNAFHVKDGSKRSKGIKKKQNFN